MSTEALREQQANVIDISEPSSQDLSVENHLGFIRKLAIPYLGGARYFGLTPEDLLQVGALEFIRKAPKYDPERAKITTYMTPVIQGVIKKEFRNSGLLLKIPRSIKDNFSRVSNTVKELYSEFGRSPSDEEVADRASLKTSLVHDIRTAIQEKAIAPTPLEVYEDTSDDKEDETPYDNVLDRMILKDGLASLTDMERRIVALRFGFNPEGKEMRQWEIGQELGMSQMHVSRLLRGAVKKLQDFFKE